MTALTNKPKTTNGKYTMNELRARHARVMQLVVELEAANHDLSLALKNNAARTLHGNWTVETTGEDCRVINEMVWRIRQANSLPTATQHIG